MLHIGYMRSSYDNCIYFKMLGDCSFIILMIYINDMLIASNNMHEQDLLKFRLWKEFDIKDLGATKEIL